MADRFLVDPVNRRAIKLTEDDVREFYKMLDSGKYYIKEICEWFGCSMSLVHKLRFRRKIYEKVLSQSARRDSR